MFSVRRAILSVLISLPVSALALITQPKQTYKIRVDVPITFSAFIPDDNIDAPAAAANFPNLFHCLLNDCVYEGDNRGFSASATSYRVRQKITLAPADPETPFGYRAGTIAPNLVLPSSLYDKASSLGTDGKLTQQAKNDSQLNDGTLKIATDVADNSSMQVATTRANSVGMRADLSGDVTNPIPYFACNITWSLSVAVDRSVSPSISLSGTRGRFPAYDMTVGVQYFQLYDPRPLGRTVLSLCLPTEDATFGADLE